MITPATPLNALVLVFAVISLAVVLLFAFAGALSFVHRRRRSRFVAKFGANLSAATKDSQLLYYLAIGDLVADKELYRQVAANRIELRSIYVPDHQKPA